jgi:ribosomal protein S18 acetylase RimI-like enzyme
VIEAVETSREDEQTRWEVRRDGAAVGTATTYVRRGGPLVKVLDVPEEDAVEAFDALLAAMTARGSDSVAVDVKVDDPVLTSAVAGRGLRVGATQMRLDLSLPVEAPSRVTLRPMTDEEYVGYRAHLVTGYADDMVQLGAFPDPADALAASEQSTRELLPDGLDSAGQHLWTAYDGGAAVGILWVHVDGARAFIYDIEVHADQRRRGYGREVLDAGALAAIDLGADVLGLNVFGHNPGAQVLYERAGYEITEQSYRIPL